MDMFRLHVLHNIILAVVRLVGPTSYGLHLQCRYSPYNTRAFYPFHPTLGIREGKFRIKVKVVTMVAKKIIIYCLRCINCLHRAWGLYTFNLLCQKEIWSKNVKNQSCSKLPEMARKLLTKIFVLEKLKVYIPKAQCRQLMHLRHLSQRSSGNGQVPSPVD